MRRFVVAGFLLSVVLGLSALASTSLKNDQHVAATPEHIITIGFVGDSITEGTLTTADQTAVSSEVKTLGGNYKAINKGVGGSTTADWLPGTKNFNDAVVAFKKANVHAVSLMLGTNDAIISAKSDSGAPTAEQYGENLRAIINGLFAQTSVKYVIINNPPFVAMSGSELDEERRPSIDSNLRSYEPIIKGIVDGKTIFKGDDTAYNFFEAHPDTLQDGIHPSAYGYEVLGQLWATAFQTNIPSDVRKSL